MPSSPVASLWPSLSQPPYSKYVSYNEDIKVEHMQMDRLTDPCYRHHFRLIRTILIVTLAFISGMIVMYIATRLTFQQGEGRPCITGSSINFEQGYNVHLGKRLMAAVSRDDMAINLRNYTCRVHISGTQGNNKLRDLLRDQLSNLSHVLVKLYPYNVLLSYPDWERPNCVSVKADDGSVVYQTGYHGPPIQDDPRPADHPELSEPYIAYSPTASVQGKLVFAEYGRVTDFKHLSERNISTSNTILLMKMGRIPIQNMVKHAELNGAAGVLLFSDSNEALSSSNAKQYLNHWMRLPGWAAARASLHLFGDPLTPGIPSREFMRRLSLTKAQLPRIPVQSIGMDDVDQLIRFATGRHETDVVAGGFHGTDASDGQQQIDYMEKELKPELWPRNWTVQLDVFNELESREITNVFGIIQGNEEPDRYVIVGCHFDAWTYGGVSPNTGTAVMMELVKALTKLKTSGWSPRRTIILANWDAGEMGLMGAFEWIEDREKVLIDRTVSYIDLNSAVSGSSTLLVQASPMIKELVLNAARGTSYRNPANGSKNSTETQCSGSTVFDAWMCHNPSQGDSKIPRFEQVSMDSEHGLFYFYLGIPVVWPRFVSLNSDGSIQYQTPVFRTSVDTFEFVHQYVDPTFETHKSMVGLIAEIVLQLSSMSRLSLDVHELSSALAEQMKVLCRRAYVYQNIFENLEAAVYNLTQTTAQFRNKFLEVEDSNALMIRQYNDKVMKFSRSFNNMLGLPGRTQFRNLLLGPASDDYSNIRVWPHIQDILDLIRDDSTTEELTHIQEQLAEEVSRAIATLHTAACILTDDMHI